MICVNPNSPEFQAALQRTGNPLLAEIEVNKAATTPLQEEIDLSSPIVRMGLKSVNALQSEKAISLFKTLEKNKVKGDAFWNKIQSDLQIPKEQIDLLKQYNTTNREELIANMLANYSYTVEINLAINKSSLNTQDDEDVVLEMMETGQRRGFADRKKGTPTQYYSNLTVPGGTNYTENEIATPAITPAIKGHAQFATDKGIGWFRSDDEDNRGWTEGDIDEKGDFVQTVEAKTRRILEVQSDLFQKGRDKKDLIEQSSKTQYGYSFRYNGFEYEYDEVYKDFAKRKIEDYQFKKISKEEFDKAVEDSGFKIGGSKENQFLQLLNQGSNWVTFFIKSIIQDSAKKGYEKVLFPSGDTASKVEGHTTLEQFKKQKEDRLKQINEQLSKGEVKENFKIEKRELYNIRDLRYTVKIENTKTGTYISTEFKTKEEAQNWINNKGNPTYEVKINLTEDELNIYKNNLIEKEALEKELERVEIEGFGALRPIYNFYENTVTNILKKQGYSPLQITDEYGNTWNEIVIKPVRDVQPIMFQLQGELETSKASPKTIKLIKEFLNAIGVQYNEVSGIVVNGKKLDANAVADITQKMIQIVEGKTDVALPEEAMHFFVEIVQQTNPQLFNELMKEINNYSILSETFKEYGNNPYYQKDGKPDVIKLKKEAIGKVLAETIIKKMEGYTERPELLAKTRNLWQRILDWFKRLISDSAFDRASLMVISGEKIGTAEDIRSEEGNIYLSETTRDTIYNKLKAVQSSISKDDDNPDEKKRGYYINGVKIPRRVTDLVNDWYERRFKEKQLNKDEFQKAVFDLKAEKGTLGHKDIEHAFHVFVDDEGFLREEPQDDSTHISHLNEEDRKMYNILKDNLRERLNSFPEGTRFLSEAIVYNEKRKIAGTIDFLAITKDGEVNILDWKFMDLNIGKYEDVPWYKVNAWRQQMQQYKLILEEAYGVKPENFRQTRMIPIKAYYTEADYKNKILPKLKEIEIGNVKVELIDKSYLIPVGLEKETTGDKNIDELLEKLNGLYSRLSEQRAIGEKEKREKARQLNSLFSAIRQLQMKKSVKQLVQQAKVLNTLIERAVANYESNWRNVSPTDKIDEEINRFYEELETLELAAQKTYSSLDTDLEFLFEGKELSDEEKEIWKDLIEVSRRTRTLAKRIDGVTTDFVDKFVAGREGVEDVLKPEKVIRNVSRQLSLTSTIQTKAMEVLYKKANRVLAYAQQDTISELRRLAELKQAYDTWALSKGLTAKNYYSAIKKKDKNQLIDEYKREFYENLQNAIEQRDFEWIRNNIDVEQYKELLKQRLEDEIESIKNRPVVTEEEERKKKFEIEDAKSLFNINNPTSPGWLLYDTAKKAPNKNKWETEEWKELNKKNDKGEYVNKPALDFYNYIRERNEYFQSIGYISKAEARIFLPYVRKTILEKALTGGNIRLGEEFLRAISIDEGDIGYGERDPLSGEIKDAIPIYMTKEIDGEVSEDLFRTMGLYNELAIKYKYLKDVEYQVRALMKVERNKKSIATTQFSKIVRDEGVIKYDESNDENAQLLQNHVRAIIYQQKYISSETFDQLLGKLGKFGEKINDKLGIKIFPENLSERQISINKSIDQLNNQFQLTALAFNVFSGLSNYMGGNFQSFINAGKYFTKTDFEKNVIWITTGKLIGNNNQKFLAAIEYFLPLTENYSREFMKQLSLKKMTQENIQQLLMIMMREGDWIIQTSNFFSFLENSVVIDGQVINAREYLRSRPEYQDMYAGSREDRLARESKFQVDLKNLLEEKSILKDGISNIKEDGTLEIVGVNRKDDSVIKLRRMVQGINSDALGNLSEDNVRSINLNIFGKSFMLFKNWIPRPIDVRMGNLKYNSAVDAYEWGRMRMVFRMLSWNVIKAMKRLIDVYQANDKGVEYMRTLWEKKRQEYKEDTNRDLKMTESQFMDLVRHNLRSTTYDAVIMLTLFALVAGLKANAPDDEEDESVKNSYRLLVRAADKLRDELLFFYDPTSLLGTVSSGIFPSISYVTNFIKLVKNFMIENYALAVDDEILEEKNQVIKYLMKTFPAVSFSSGLLPALYPELAKELGIRATTESRPVGR